MTCIGSEELFKQSRKLLFCVVRETLGDYVVSVSCHETCSMPSAPI